MPTPTRSGCVVAAALALLALASETEASARLRLAWIDPSHLAPGVYPALVAQTTAVLEELGASAAWTEAEEGAVFGPETLAVIAVGAVPAAWLPARHVMGATVAAAEAPPALWVYPEEVARALGLELRERGAWGPAERAMFARALGRVVGHELLHVLGVSQHARRGLMAASLDRRALIAPDLAVDDRSASIVRRGLARGGLLARVSAPGRSAPGVAVPDLLSEGPTAHY